MLLDVLSIPHPPSSSTMFRSRVKITIMQRSPEARKYGHGSWANRSGWNTNTNKSTNQPPLLLSDERISSLSRDPTGVLERVPSIARSEIEQLRMRGDVSSLAFQNAPSAVGELDALHFNNGTHIAQGVACEIQQFGARIPRVCSGPLTARGATIEARRRRRRTRTIRAGRGRRRLLAQPWDEYSRKPSRDYIVPVR